MKQFGLIITQLCLLSTLVFADGSIVLQPGSDVGKDAYVCDCVPDANNAGYSQNSMSQGKWKTCYARTFIGWDLSSVDTNLEIVNATMALYCNGRSGTPTGQMVFYRITEAWDENTVTHNNSPAYDEASEILVDWPEPKQWISIDITSFVKEWLQNPSSNFGVMGHCVNTQATFYVNLITSDYSKAETHPKLTITYEGSSSAIDAPEAVQPTHLGLSAYPNPFNPNTSISFTTSKPEAVTLKIFDLSGQQVATLLEEVVSQGEHQVNWHADNFSSGLYLCCLQAGQAVQTQKLILQK